MNEIDITTKKCSPDNALSPVNRKEVLALMAYASETGIDPKGELISLLNDALKSNNENEILKLYSSLCKITYSLKGVNGRTLIETDTCFSRRSRVVLAWALFFLALALSAEALDLWFSDNDVPSEGLMYYFFNIHIYFLDRFSPFLWGATGASVFLIKQLSDRASDRCFDSKRWKGWGTRIILGALLGAIVVSIYDPSSFTEDKINIDANVIAFLTGVGTKLFYGGIEKLIETLALRFNISEEEEKGKTPTEILSEYLGGQLAVAMESGDEGRIKTIKDMLSELSPTNTPAAQ